MADKKDKRVQVFHPDGRTGTIPEAQLDRALKQGFRKTLTVKQQDKPSGVSDFFGTLKQDIIDPAIHLGGVTAGLTEPQTKLGQSIKKIPAPLGGQFGQNLQGAIGDLAEGGIRAQGEQLGQAGELIGKVFGEDQSLKDRALNALEAAGRTGAGIVPVIGPFAAEIGEAIGEKRLGKVAAKGLELSFGFSRTRAGLKPIQGIPKVVSRKLGFALRPRQTAKVALQKSLPSALEELKIHLRRTNKRPPQSLQELQQLTSEARQLIGKEIEATTGPSKAIIFGDDLISSTKKGISKPSRILDDKAVAGLKKLLNAN
ncbi:hypothetical protein LCGC14_1424300 [marine sediment metagenome]|uniref:Uncharacterized protein n=1 Tax=marine sediment metagenome TaxID=412755 RepID=A0A0F9MS65_9ZZZZ